MASLALSKVWLRFLLLCLTGCCMGEVWAVHLSARTLNFSLQAMDETVTKKLNIYPEGVSELIYEVKAEHGWPEGLSINIRFRNHNETLSEDQDVLILPVYDDREVIYMKISAEVTQPLPNKETVIEFLGYGDNPSFRLLLHANFKQKKAPRKVVSKKKSITCRKAEAGKQSVNLSQMERSVYLMHYTRDAVLDLCNESQQAMELNYQFFPILFNEKGDLLEEQGLGKQNFRISDQLLQGHERKKVSITPPQALDDFYVKVSMYYKGKVNKLEKQIKLIFLKKIPTTPKYKVVKKSYYRYEKGVELAVVIENQGKRPLLIQGEMALRGRDERVMVRLPLETLQPFILPGQRLRYSSFWRDAFSYPTDFLWVDLYLQLNERYMKRNRFHLKF